uniref:Uncharacterized protein n=1 Tax=Setaria italica TaxID=4555 RepID=K3XQV4_SETIT
MEICEKTKPLSFMDRLKEGCDDIENLEEMIDVERYLERYQRDTLRKIRPQQIYQMGWFENKNGLYRISREVELSVLTEPVQLRITKGYEDFKGTNLLVSIEFVGRLTNRSATKYKVNVNNVIESMQSKGIKFMSPLKISSEERAGEEWNISAVIEPKILKQPKDYVSYENSKGKTSIRFVNYKERSLDDLEVSTSDSNIEEARRHSVCEFMEKLDIDNEIKHYEKKLSKVQDEYNTSMICEWSAIREKELYFRRELYRLNKIKKERELNNKRVNMPIMKHETTLKHVSDKNSKIQKELENNKEKAKEEEEVVISEEDQWEINNKILLESYEEEDEDIIEIHSKQDKDIKIEGERDRPSRKPGNWPPEKEEATYTYIPGQYKHMGSKRREFERTMQFQNYRSDGAILNLATHDPIDWPNIISIWKSLIVQKYIQNQHNIGSRVEDMITYLETFLGESVKVLWDQWIETYPHYYEELKRAGSNPYNFANIISSIVIDEDPELGYTTLQNERLKEIEKLTLTNWKGIKEFSQHYLYNATTAKQGYNKSIVERKEYNISQAITFVFKQLRKICTSIQAQ